MIKTLQKVSIEWTYLNIIKALYDRPTANIILNGEKLKVFSLRSGTRQRSHSQHFYSTWCLEVLVTTIRQEKAQKEIEIRKEEVKLSLFADDMILFIENPKDDAKNPQKHYENSSMNLVKPQDTKLIYRNVLHFYTLIMNCEKEKLRKQFHLQVHQRE